MIRSVVVVGSFSFEEFSEVGQSGVPLFLTIRLHFIFRNFPFVKFTTRIHLFNKEQDLVLVVDRFPNNLETVFVFVQVATKCDDVLFSHPLLVERCYNVGFFLGEHFAQCGADVEEHGLDGLIGISKIFFIILFHIFFLHALSICSALILLTACWLSYAFLLARFPPCVARICYGVDVALGPCDNFSSLVRIAVLAADFLVATL